MNCPICADNNATEYELAGFEKTFQINCRRCGEYIAKDSFMHNAPKNLNADQIGKISGWVYENPQRHLDEKDWKFLTNLPTLSIGEKADKLLIYLSKKFPRPNQQLAYQASGEELSCCYAADRDEGNYLFTRYLKEYKKLISTPLHGGEPIVISPSGWDYLHSLKKVNLESTIGFCAMWFDDTILSLWIDAIEPAIFDSGYEAVRIDRYHHNNRIDDEIIAMIKKSRFVVADFTENRGGVYFEAGYALGMGLPVIWTVRKDDLDKIHFDNRQYSFVVWDDQKMAQFRSDLTNRIKATIGEGSFRRDYS